MLGMPDLARRGGGQCAPSSTSTARCPSNMGLWIAKVVTGDLGRSMRLNEQGDDPDRRALADQPAAGLRRHAVSRCFGL